MRDILDIIKEKFKDIDMALGRQIVDQVSAGHGHSHVARKVSSTDWADMLKMHINQVSTFKPSLQFNVRDFKKMITKKTNSKKQKAVLERDDDDENDDDDCENDDSVQRPIVAEIDLNFAPTCQVKELHRNADDLRREFVISYPDGRHCRCCEQRQETSNANALSQYIQDNIVASCGQCIECDKRGQGQRSLNLFFASIARSTYDFCDDEILELEIETLKTVKTILAKRSEQLGHKFCGFRDAAVSCVNLASGSVSEAAQKFIDYEKQNNLPRAVVPNELEKCTNSKELTSCEAPDESRKSNSSNELTSYNIANDLTKCNTLNKSTSCNILNDFTKYNTINEWANNNMRNTVPHGNAVAPNELSNFNELNKLSNLNTPKVVTHSDAPNELKNCIAPNKWTNYNTPNEIINCNASDESMHRKLPYTFLDYSARNALTNFKASNELSNRITPNVGMYCNASNELTNFKASNKLLNCNISKTVTTSTVFVSNKFTQSDAPLMSEQKCNVPSELSIYNAENEFTICKTTESINRNELNLLSNCNVTNVGTDSTASNELSNSNAPCAVTNSNISAPNVGSNQLRCESAPK